MDLKLLEDFITLAEQRSFTRAAEIRNVTQATLSRRIQSLEHWAGTALVKKGVYPTVLTEAGEALLRGSKESVQQLLMIRALIRSKQFAAMSQIRVAVTDVVARAMFNDIFGGFARKVGDSILVFTGHVPEMHEKFLAGGVDILVTYYDRELHHLLDTQEFPRLLLQKDRFRAYSRKDGKWDEGIFEGASAKQAVPVCGYGPEAFLGQLQEAIIERNGDTFPYRIAAQSNATTVVKSFITNGYGVGWLPSSFLTTEDRRALGTVSTPAYETDLEVFAIAKTGNPDPSVRRLWDFLSSKSLARETDR
jgi:DNA-binding transcriptional LysR family regulator